MSASLSERVVATVQDGALRPEAARRIEVRRAGAVHWHEAMVRECRNRTEPMRGDQRSHAIEARADLIRETCEAQPRLFLRQLR